MWNRKQAGFTLIELMIVVAVVGILAAVAIPSYREQIRSSNRADAQGALSGLAQAMERHFTQNGTYVGADDGSGVPVIFPTQAPLDGSSKMYNLRITSVTASTYTLQAQPINGTGQAGDGFLQMTSAGQKGWDRDNSGALNTGEGCWKKSC